MDPFTRLGCVFGASYLVGSRATEVWRILHDLGGGSERRRLGEGIFGSYQMSYSIELDLCIDVILMFCAKIPVFLKEDSKKGRCSRRHSKQIIIILAR